MSCYRYSLGHKKKRETCTFAVPLVEAFALPLVLKRQREAHAEYKILSCYIIVKVRVCAYTYTQMAYQIGTRGIILYPVGHLPLLSSEYLLKFAKFLQVRTKR